MVQVTGEELAKEFKEHSVAEFFKKNRQMLGLSGKIRALTTIVHEYVTNSVTHETPTIIRVNGEIQIKKIGETVDSLMEKNGFEFNKKQEAESLREFEKFEVLCFDKNSNKLKFKEVQSLHRHKMKLGEKIFKIKTIGNRFVEATKHHGLFTLRNGKVSEVKAEELNVGDYLVVPRKKWIQETKKEINLLKKALTLSDNKLNEFSVFGVKKILNEKPELKNKIKSQLSKKERNLDFYRNYMKCDRLPLRLLKILNEEEREIFYKCKIGARHAKHKVNAVIPVTKELMQIIGFYIAEGNTRKTLMGMTLSFGSHESEIIEYVKKLFKNVFGIACNESKAHRTAVNITVPSMTLSFIFSEILECGKKAKEKMVPSIVFSSGETNAKNFLFAYLAGDAYPSKKIFNSLLNETFSVKEKITLATASSALNLSLEYLLSALGYSYSKSENKEEKRIVNGKSANFSKSYLIEFYSSQKNSPLNFYPIEIGGLEALIEPKLKWAINARGQKTVSYEKIASLKFNEAKISFEAANFIGGDLGLIQISEITQRIPSDEFVYDYSVEGDENFVGGFGAICLHNSLDACEEANILPEIEVRITEISSEYYEIYVKDNGPGLTEITVGKAFGKLLAGTKFHRLMQSRGQQGIGAAGATMLAQMTTGKPIQVITGTEKGKTISAEISVDTKTNEPKVTDLKVLEKKFRGTAVKSRFKGVKYVNNDQSPLEYLRRTAISNPHATIEFTDPSGEKISFKRTNNQIPKRPFEVKPHPKGSTVDDLVTVSKKTDARKVSTFLKTEFDRMGDKAVEQIAKNISFDLNKDPKQLTWDEAEEIVKQFKKINFIAPRIDALRPIGEERIRKSMEAIIEPEFISSVTRKPQVYSGGFPFQVEAAVAFGGKAGRSMAEEIRTEIMRYANRAPLLFDGGGCAITKASQSIDWKRYGIKDLDNSPLSIFVNIVSVFIPYTSAGKQAISDEEEVMEELRLAIMDAARKTAQYILGKKKEQERKMKREIFFKYIPEIAEALGDLTKTPHETISKKLEKMVLEKLKLEDAAEEAQKTEATAKEETKESKKEKIEKAKEESEETEKKEKKKKVN